MSADNKKNIKEELPKKIINSLIENYSLKSVIDNLYNKSGDLDLIHHPLYFMKSKKGLPYLTNLLYDFKDKLVLSDVKNIPNIDKTISLQENNENGINNIKKNKNLVVEFTENTIIIPKSIINLQDELLLKFNKNCYSSKLRSNNKKDEEINNNSKIKFKKNLNRKRIKVDKIQNGEQKLCGFKKKFSRRIIPPSKLIKQNNILLENIEQNKLPHGLLIDSIDYILDTNPDEIYFEEEYTKKYFAKSNLDSQLLDLQNQKLGKDIRLGSHFNRDEEGNLYLYNISVYGENGLIKMKCSNQSCKSVALYNFITKIFYIVEKHTISAENHKLRNLPSFRISDYVTFMERHKEITNLQILKVPRDKFCKIYCITYVNEKESVVKNNNNENDPEVNDEMSQYVYEYDYNINDGNEEEIQNIN